MWRRRGNCRKRASRSWDLPYRHQRRTISAKRCTRWLRPMRKAKNCSKQATEQFRLSMRGYTRVLRVARTIADLEGSETVSQQHVGEALSYRQMQFGRVAEEA